MYRAPALLSKYLARNELKPEKAGTIIALTHSLLALYQLAPADTPACTRYTASSLQSVRIPRGHTANRGVLHPVMLDFDLAAVSIVLSTLAFENGHQRNLLRQSVDTPPPPRPTKGRLKRLCQVHLVCNARHGYGSR